MFVLDVFREEANRMLRDAGVLKEVEEAKEGFGDFTLPCFEMAKEQRKSPVLIAKELKEIIGESEFFEKIEAVGPYLNFHISRTRLSEITLASILEGSIFDFGKRGRVVVEHTSANPTGPLHVGRARNPIIGDTMARIYREYGHEVEVQYFVNDAGMQVATLLWGLLNLSAEGNEEKCDHRYVGYYQRANAMMEDGDVESKIRELMKRYEDGDPQLREFAREKIGCMLDGIRETLERINVNIDRFVWESSLIPVAREIAKELDEYVEEENGAFYISMKKMGVELQKDRFFLYRKDGTTLYFLRDIAYHLHKAESSRVLVDVLGEDHKLHFQALKAVVNLLRPEVEMLPLFYSFVRLPEGKMSTRKGTVVYLDELLDEGRARALEILKERNYTQDEAERIAESIAASSIRYSILNVQEEKPIVFRWEKALSFEGESAPFIIYTYARASSILKKSTWNGDYDPTLLIHEQERNLLKLMAGYPSVLRSSVETRSPYLLAKYAYFLAMQFNQFYRDCPVLSSEEELKNARLAVVKAFKTLLGRVLNVLGLEALEKM